MFSKEESRLIRTEEEYLWKMIFFSRYLSRYKTEPIRQFSVYTLLLFGFLKTHSNLYRLLKFNLSVWSTNGVLNYCETETTPNNPSTVRGLKQEVTTELIDLWTARDVVVEL